MTPCGAAPYNFSKTRKWAERLRRLPASSSGFASMGLRVISFALALPPQTQTGNSGGQVQAVAQRRNLFFTSLSSKEWKVMTHSLPPGASAPKMASSPSSSASSSWLTALF